MSAQLAGLEEPRDEDRLGDGHPPFVRQDPVGEHDNDLTCRRTREPLGERIVVSGRVPDDLGQPARRTLLYAAVYCGVPAANAAFAVAERVLHDEGRL